MNQLLFIDDGIYEIDKKIIDDANHVINFSHITINSRQELDKSKAYNKIRYDLKDEYIKFIYKLGNEIINGKSIKQHFMIDSYSLWWLSEIQHKDTFYDSFFDDLCKAYLLKSLENDYKINLISNSPLLLYLFKNKKYNIYKIIFNSILRRIKKFTLLFYNKIFLHIRFPSIDSKDCHTAFFCHDVNLVKNNKAKLCDRFFRNIPDNVNAGCLIIKLTKFAFNIPSSMGNQIIIDRYFDLFTLINNFFNFKYAFKYTLIRKHFLSLCHVGNIDVTPIFDLYMWETVLNNDFYYISLIDTLGRIDEKIHINKYVNYGEFGLPVRSIVIAAKKTNKEVIWMQHGIVLEWELNFNYYPSEILDKSLKINSDFIEYLPVCDKYFVWGEWLKEILINSGYPKERIYTLGSHSHDYLKALQKKHTAQNNKECKTILVCPSVTIHEILLFSHIALLIKNKFTMFEVILKLHPRQISSIDTENQLKQCIDQGIRVSSNSMRDFINSVDIVIVGASSIGIEFSYLKKNVIYFSNNYINRYAPPWINHKYSVTNYQELIDNIIHYSKKQVKYNYYIGEPGNSEEKIIQMLN